MRVPNAPVLLDMNTFRASLDGAGNVAKQCRFAVRILPSGNPNNILARAGAGPFMQDLTYLVDATELPGRGFDYVETRYYGPSVYFPRNSKYGGSIQLSLLCRNASFERFFFDSWLETINPTNTFDFNYAQDYYAEIQLFQYAEFGMGPMLPNPVYKWSLLQAWPMLVEAQPVTWADTDVLRLKVEFAYRFWRRPGIDKDPTTSELSYSIG